MVTRGTILILLATALLWSATAGAARFTADVDRRELYADEHVVLTLALENSETRLRARGVKPNIDLTVLTDQFELGVPRTDFRFNIERNRGRATSELTVELFPRTTGRLVIPSFSVDGLSTETIALKVEAPPGDAPPEIYALSGVTKRELWVREQTVVYLDLYHRVNLAGAKLGGAVDIEPHGVELHELPQSDRTEQVDGLKYNITRTAWALSPRDPGTITVYMPDIWVETRDGDRRRLPFREERIEARALPPAVPPHAPVGRPQLEQSAPETATTGRLVPWEISLAAPTALNTLPAALPLPALPPRLKAYTDTTERRIETLADGTTVSRVVYRIYLMAEAPGDYELAALELPYFDPGRGRMALARLPGPELHVEPAPPSAATPGAGAETPAARLPDAPTRPATGGANSAGWQTATWALLVLWLATVAVAWRLHRGRHARPGGGAPHRPPATTGDDPKARLLAALGARTLEQGLNERERRHGPDPELRAAVRAVQRRCYGRDTGAGEETALHAAVDQVIARLEGNPATAPSDGTVDPWSPRAFFQAVKNEK